jgi:hypothetical protein
VTGVVADNVTVQNQNSADNPSATSGEATVSNDTGDGFSLGPRAITDTGTAQASQFGGNEADITQSAIAESGDAVAGSQVTGIVGGGEHVVQNSNNAFCDLDPCAFSGDADASNTADVSVGPFAETDDTAQVSQTGDNDAVLSQSSLATSGDSLFGSQVTGVVGGSATVQNQNSSSSDGLGAESGPATASNTAAPLDGVAVAGPQASGTTAGAQQTGDNRIDAAQEAEGRSGDALSGAQVTGAVGDEGGFLTVSNQQASEGDEVISGDVAATNDADIEAGAQALGTDVAQASQNGDNDVTSDQNVLAKTGDALAGAQVTGDVGHEDVTVQSMNSSLDAVATSGDVVDATNVLVASAGPFADADRAQTSQLGDNAADASQSVAADTGDAVAGSQVIGVVASGSTVTVQSSNSSVASEATSGTIDLDVVQSADVTAGPTSIGDTLAQTSQTGDNAAALAQDAALATGDAVAGGQVTGIVDDDGAAVTVQNQNSSDADIATSGDVLVTTANEAAVAASAFAEADVAGTVQSQQTGDNTVAADQSAALATGDAVGGGQVTGVVSGDSSDVTVSNMNSAFEADVVSGSVEAEVVNDLSADAGSGMQLGDNEVTAGQEALLSTGDAVGASQVTGVVTGDDSTITIQSSNACDGDPCATVDSGLIDIADAANVAGIGVGAFVESGTAQASQFGDNAASVAQSVDASTGDAVGGSQVTGTVAGDGSETTVMNQNTASGPIVTSGSVTGASNDLTATVGVEADAITGNAQAQQTGDNDLDFTQDISAGSGDAVAGAQVTGTVGGEATISVTGSSVDPDASSGDVDGENDASGSVGVTATSPANAMTSQSGDSNASGSQDLSIDTGDAVSGSQVEGSVGSPA